MEFYLNWSATAAQDVPQAANSNIRFYDMKARWRTDAVEWDASVLDSLNHLQYYKDTRWTVCSPETAGNFRRWLTISERNCRIVCKSL